MPRSHIEQERAFPLRNYCTDRRNSQAHVAVRNGKGTSLFPSGSDVCESEEANGDGRPAGERGWAVHGD